MNRRASILKTADTYERLLQDEAENCAAVIDDTDHVYRRTNRNTAVNESRSLGQNSDGDPDSTRPVIPHTSSHSDEKEHTWENIADRGESHSPDSGADSARSSFVERPPIGDDDRTWPPGSTEKKHHDGSREQPSVERSPTAAATSEHNTEDETRKGCECCSSYEYDPSSDNNSSKGAPDHFSHASLSSTGSTIKCPHRERALLLWRRTPVLNVPRETHLASPAVVNQPQNASNMDDKGCVSTATIATAVVAHKERREQKPENDNVNHEMTTTSATYRSSNDLSWIETFRTARSAEESEDIIGNSYANGRAVPYSPCPGKRYAVVVKTGSDSVDPDEGVARATADETLVQQGLKEDAAEPRHGDDVVFPGSGDLSVTERTVLHQLQEEVDTLKGELRKAERRYVAAEATVDAVLDRARAAEVSRDVKEIQVHRRSRTVALWMDAYWYLLSLPAT